MRRLFQTISGALVLWGAFSFSSLAAPPEEILREERTVVVQGVKETWRLVWIGKPSSVCGPEEGDLSLTCPCNGFAYGEKGNLWLLRLRNSQEVERLDLKTAFRDAETPNDGKEDVAAFLQHWPTTANDFEKLGNNKVDNPALIAKILRRRATPVMTFADYDHDGGATEFLLQVGVEACGHRDFVAVGLTPGNPHLHVLTTASKPNAPLVLPPQAWRALARSAGPTTVTEWACDDHGSQTQTNLVVSADHGQIRVKVRELSCPAGKSQKLIRETDWGAPEP